VVRVPPLAERSEDVVPLAARLAEAAAAELGRAAPRLSPRAIDRLQARPWPGNVRELAAVMAGAVALAADGLVDAEHLSPAEGRPAAGPEGAPPAIDLSVPFAELKRQWIDHFERGYVAAALRRCDGNLSAAARLARMDKKNFHAKASRHGLAGVVPRRGGALKTRSSRHRMPRPPGGSAEGGDG
jgi:two-component system response regulator GlrR